MTDAEQMVELMRYASNTKVAAALGVSKTTTGDWARGRNVTPYRVRQVRDLLRPSEPQSTELVLLRRALAGIMALELRDGVTAAMTAEMAPQVAELERVPMEMDRRIAAELAATQQRSSVPATGRDAGLPDVSPGSKRPAR